MLRILATALLLGLALAHAQEQPYTISSGRAVSVTDAGDIFVAGVTLTERPTDTPCFVACFDRSY